MEVTSVIADTRRKPSWSVGSIDLILESIFHNFSGKELLNARLVNKTWLRVATDVAKSRKCLKVVLPQLDLPNHEELVAAIESETFPGVVQQWKFPSYNPVNADSLIMCPNLSRMIGGNASGLILELDTFLKIWLVSPNVRCPLLPAFGFLSDANQITQLSLTGVKNGSGRHHIPRNFVTSWRSKLQLKNLKKLELTPGIIDFSSFLEIVLHVAPNLKVITGFDLSMTDLVGEAGKIHCVESLVIKDEEPDIVTTIAKFCSHNPALKFLEIIAKEEAGLEKNEETNRAIAELLVANQKSLIRVKVSSISCIDGIVTLAPPIFENLRVLELCNGRVVKRRRTEDANFIKRILPSGFNPATSFPRLNEVILALKGLKVPYLEEYFPDDDYARRRIEEFPTVQKLEIKCGYDKAGIAIIAAKFPNVKDVKFYQVLHNYSYCLTTDIWRLPQTVQSLTLHFYAVDHAQHVKHLDSLLTGIPQNTMMKIKRDELKKIKLKAIAPRKNIRSYANLKSLKIIFDGDEFQLLRNREEGTGKKDEIFLKEDTLTLASALYGFQPAPETKVCIAFDHRTHYAERLREILLPIEPYITFYPFFKSDGTAENF